MKEKTRRILNDIIELANRLQSHQFEQSVIEKGLHFSISGIPEGDYLIHFEFPNDTVIDATLYTFRLFNQQGETVSFHRLDKLAEDTGLSEKFRDGITKLRNEYFNFLSQYPSGVEPGFFEDGCHPNNGEILRVVINGGYGHRRDLKKRQKYKTWTRDGIREGVLYQKFSEIVFRILRLIRQLQLLCEIEITQSASVTG